MELGERRPVGGKTGDAQEMHQAVTAQLDVVKPVAAPGVGGSGSGHGGNLSGASSEERTSTGCHKFPGFRQGFQQLWWQARCSTRRVARVMAAAPNTWRLPLLVLALTVSLGVWGTVAGANKAKEHTRAMAQADAVIAARSFELSLQATYAPCVTLSILAQLYPQWSDLEPLFNTFAPQLLEQLPSSQLLEIKYAPQGIVQLGYPPDASVLGSDLFMNANVSDLVYQTLKAGSLLVTGPQVLVASDPTLAARLPVFVDASANDTFGMPHTTSNCSSPLCYDPATSRRFWGFAIALIKWDDLTGPQSELAKLAARKNYHWELRVPNTSDPSQSEIVAASDPPPDDSDIDDFVVAPILVRGHIAPNISGVTIPQVWYLAVSPVGGIWPSWVAPAIVGVVLGSVIISLLLCGLLVNRMHHVQARAALKVSNRHLEDATHNLQSEKMRLDALLVRQLNLLNLFSAEEESRRGFGAMSHAQYISKEEDTVEAIESLRRTMRAQHGYGAPGSMRTLSGRGAQLLGGAGKGAAAGAGAAAAGGIAGGAVDTSVHSAGLDAGTAKAAGVYMLGGDGADSQQHCPLGPSSNLAGVEVSGGRAASQAALAAGAAATAAAAGVPADALVGAPAVAVHQQGAPGAAAVQIDSAALVLMEAVAAASPGAAVAGHDSVPLRKRAASMYSLDQQLKVVRLIGEGTFGKVYEGIWQGTQVAIKTLVLPANMSGAEKREKMAIMEAAISSSLSHPNIVQTYTYNVRPICDDAGMLEEWGLMSVTSGDGGEAEVPPTSTQPVADADVSAQLAKRAQSRRHIHSYEVRLVLEFCDRGNLRDAADHGAFFGSDGLNYRGILDCAIDMAKALLHLHSLNILHGDLKARNVLLRSSGSDGRGVVAKVGDFGLSVSLDQLQTHVSAAYQGTLTHMAPEILLHGRVSKAADVYAFGITLWELFTAGEPFKGVPLALLGHAITRDGMRPDFPAITPAAYRALAESCWQADPAKRPSFEEILAQLTAIRAAEGGHTPKVSIVMGANGPVAPGPLTLGVHQHQHHHQQPYQHQARPRHGSHSRSPSGGRQTDPSSSRPFNRQLTPSRLKHGTTAADPPTPSAPSSPPPPERSVSGTGEGGALSGSAGNTMVPFRPGGIAPSKSLGSIASVGGMVGHDGTTAAPVSPSASSPAAGGASPDSTRSLPAPTVTNWMAAAASMSTPKGGSISYGNRPGPSAGYYPRAGGSHSSHLPTIKSGVPSDMAAPPSPHNLPGLGHQTLSSRLHHWEASEDGKGGTDSRAGSNTGAVAGSTAGSARAIHMIIGSPSPGTPATGTSGSLSKRASGQLSPGHSQSVPMTSLAATPSTAGGAGVMGDHRSVTSSSPMQHERNSAGGTRSSFTASGALSRFGDATHGPPLLEATALDSTSTGTSLHPSHRPSNAEGSGRPEARSDLQQRLSSQTDRESWLMSSPGSTDPLPKVVQATSPSGESGSGPLLIRGRKSSGEQYRQGNAGLQAATEGSLAPGPPHGALQGAAAVQQGAPAGSKSQQVPNSASLPHSVVQNSPGVDGQGTTGAMTLVPGPTSHQQETHQQQVGGGSYASPVSQGGHASTFGTAELLSLTEEEDESSGPQYHSGNDRQQGEGSMVDPPLLLPLYGRLSTEGGQLSSSTGVGAITFNMFIPSSNAANMQAVVDAESEHVGELDIVGSRPASQRGSTTGHPSGSHSSSVMHSSAAHIPRGPGFSRQMRSWSATSLTEHDALQRSQGGTSAGPSRLAPAAGPSLPGPPDTSLVNAEEGLLTLALASASRGGANGGDSEADTGGEVPTPRFVPPTIWVGRAGDEGSSVGAGSRDNDHSICVSIDLDPVTQARYRDGLASGSSHQQSSSQSIEQGSHVLQAQQPPPPVWVSSAPNTPSVAVQPSIPEAIRRTSSSGHGKGQIPPAPPPPSPLISSTTGRAGAPPHTHLLPASSKPGHSHAMLPSGPSSSPSVVSVSASRGLLSGSAAAATAFAAAGLPGAAAAAAGMGAQGWHASSAARGSGSTGGTGTAGTSSGGGTGQSSSSARPGNWQYLQRQAATGSHTPESTQPLVGRWGASHSQPHIAVSAGDLVAQAASLGAGRGAAAAGQSAPMPAHGGPGRSGSMHAHRDRWGAHIIDLLAPSSTGTALVHAEDAGSTSHGSTMHVHQHQSTTGRTSHSASTPEVTHSQSVSRSSPASTRVGSMAGQDQDQGMEGAHVPHFPLGGGPTGSHVFGTAPWWKQQQQHGPHGAPDFMGTRGWASAALGSGPEGTGGAAGAAATHGSSAASMPAVNLGAARSAPALGLGQQPVMFAAGLPPYVPSSSAAHRSHQHNRPGGDAGLIRHREHQEMYLGGPGGAWGSTGGMAGALPRSSDAMGGAIFMRSVLPASTGSLQHEPYGGLGGTDAGAVVLGGLATLEGYEDDGSNRQIVIGGSMPGFESLHAPHHSRSEGANVLGGPASAELPGPASAAWADHLSGMHRGGALLRGRAPSAPNAFASGGVGVGGEFGGVGRPVGGSGGGFGGTTGVSTLNPTPGPSGSSRHSRHARPGGSRSPQYPSPSFAQYVAYRSGSRSTHAGSRHHGPVLVSPWRGQQLSPSLQRAGSTGGAELGLAARGAGMSSGAEPSGRGNVSPPHGSVEGLMADLPAIIVGDPLDDEGGAAGGSSAAPGAGVGPTTSKADGEGAVRHLLKSVPLMPRIEESRPSLES